MARCWLMASVVGVFKLVRDFLWYGVDKTRVAVWGGRFFSEGWLMRDEGLCWQIPWHAWTKGAGLQPRNF